MCPLAAIGIRLGVCVPLVENRWCIQCQRTKNGPKAQLIVLVGHLCINVPSPMYGHVGHKKVHTPMLLGSDGAYGFEISF